MAVNSFVCCLLILLISSKSITGREASDFLGAITQPNEVGSRNDFKNIDVRASRDQEWRLQRPMRRAFSFLNRPIRKATTDPEKHWPGGVIPYRIDDGGDFSFQDRMILQAAMHMWSADTCIMFRPATSDDKDYIVFTGGDYCWSYIGRKGGEQLLMLNKTWCRDLRTVLHEVGHSIGLHHEQNRPDRDDFVRILWENIPDEEEYNFQKVESSNAHGSPYDYASVMHYRNNEFSQKRGKNTIKALAGNRGETMGRLSELSFYDVRTVSLMYKCHERCGVYIAALACREGGEGFMGRDCRCYYKESYSTHIIAV